MSGNDQNNKQLKIADYLPEVYQSDVNKSLTEMVFDRYLSKDDTTHVSGFVGSGNKNSLVDRQIKESATDPHEEVQRQAYQLVPIVHTKIGTEDKALSFRNFLTQLELQGVDLSRLNSWGSTDEFNWVPPINIDMLINYQDYFWNTSDVSSLPQYFTIENQCNKATDKVTAYNSLMEQRGIHFTIVDIDFANNIFVVQGKWDIVFSAGFQFRTNISTTINLENRFWTVSSSTYDNNTGKTKITVVETIARTNEPISPIDGEWWYDSTATILYMWNSIQWIEYTNSISAQIILPALFSIQGSSFADQSFVIDGRQDDLFTPGFVFVTKHTSSANLENKFWTTLSVSFDESTYKTTIRTVEPLAFTSEIEPNNLTVGGWWYQPSTNTLRTWDGISWNNTNQTILGNISLSELLLVFQSSLNCKCNYERGWDIGLWDDNSLSNLVWNTALLDQITHSTEAEWLTHNVDNAEVVNDGVPNNFSIWYDTTTDQLKQYGDRDHPIPTDPEFTPQWEAVMQNFSAVLAITSAQEDWEESADCATIEVNEWSNTNKWQHKTAIKSYANARRAQMPIFEYDSNIEINKWTKINHAWKYRSTQESSFVASTYSPSRIELEPIKGYYFENDNGNLYLFDKFSTMNVNIDYTSIFIPGYQFKITDNNGLNDVYTVDSSEFIKLNSTTVPALQGDFMVTVVKIKESLFSSPTVGGPNNVRIIPTLTSTGDIWLGYHVHWVLDVTSTTTSPIQHQPLNVFSNIDKVTGGVLEAVVGNSKYNSFTPQVNEIRYGTTFQELIINIPNVYTIDLVKTLQYDPTCSSPYAIVNSNDLRVYVNNIRQYGTYNQITAFDYPSYTIIGNTTLDSSPQIEYIKSIQFENPLKIADIVRIEVGPASLFDMGMYSLPVRTVENDEEFNTLVNLAQQPIYRSLCSYELNEQSKTELNQYPLFNIYDIITNNVVKASPIITFKENLSQPIHSIVQRRIVLENDGDYVFEQFLIEGDNGILYGYRDKTLTSGKQYWFNPNTNQLLYWDKSAWSNIALVYTTTGLSVRIPIVSNIDPVHAWEIEQAIWFNTESMKLFSRNPSKSRWEEITFVVISATDPTLQTIWRTGTSNAKYTPKYVNKERQEVQIGNIDGNWEVMKQWIYNPEHYNRSELKFSQLVTHFKTIIDNQPSIPGLIGGGTYTRFQSEYDYSVGGTIKEFNGAFDTLISAINVLNTTPVGVMEFAAREYAANIRLIRDLFNKSIIELFSNYSTSSFLTFSSYITRDIISQYENNDFMQRVYADSSAYNEESNKGIRNWIATIPMFGLGKAYRPHIISDDKFTQVFHHDGHRTNIIYTTAEEDMLARKIISLSDNRIVNGKLGNSGNTIPPATEAEFISLFGGTTIRTGVFWYRTGLSRSFYRFELYSIGPIHPSVYFNNTEIPDNTLYYNTTTHNVFKKIGLSWVAETPYGSYDITPLWKIINFRQLLGELYLEIENRLFDACDNISPVFDYSSLTPNVSEQIEYNNIHKKRFEEYIATQSIQTPYINTQYRTVDAFTWNYASSPIASPPHDTSMPELSACWQSIYTNWYGTPYPHLEPWKLQGYTDKPVWWDDEYLETDGSRRWKFVYNPIGISVGVGMWENIRAGQVPMGRNYPDGRISTGNSILDGQTLTKYSYFSVNISNNTISGGYGTDQLLPPYYSSTDNVLRSIYTTVGQIIAPDADYSFGDGNPTDWQWSVSALYAYDTAIAAFLMQPIKFLRAAFGPMYTLVNGLEVDTLFKKVYNHRETLFHGELYDTNLTYSTKGINQWYINYNRFAGFDVNEEFRDLWTKWTPLLAYQFNDIIDTSTLTVTNKNFDMTSEDYTILLTNSDVIKDIWVDTFNVTVLNIPPSIIQYNNENKWKFEINSSALTAREIPYYDVKAYPFMVNPATDICYIHRYKITNVDPLSNRFYVQGNHINTFVPAMEISVTGSSFNNGIYQVLSSVYEPTTDATRINIAQTLQSGVDGYIGINSYELPWSTGDMVVLSSQKILPHPLVQNTPYFIINTGNQTFKLAETYSDALNNVSIDITAMGVDNHTIAEISSSFIAMDNAGNSKETWYHYALDKNIIRTMTPPTTINGMQTLINIIDGFSEYQRDMGIITNTADSSDFDPITGRLINWELETERFIDWAYGLRSRRMSINDRFECAINLNDNTLSFVDSIPQWSSGTAVQLSSTGILPSPLIVNETYYVYQTGNLGIIKLSTSRDVTNTLFHVDLLSLGSGHTYISSYSNLQSYPQYEINPNRNNIWFDTPEGVLSHVIQGPYTDIRIRQAVYDQYGRVVDKNNLLIFRSENRSRISIVPKIQNDVDKFYLDDPYNYLHLGGCHVFLEGYEHFILFNPYTIDNFLIYDSFLGLQAPKFELNFMKKTNKSSKPSLGGFYLTGHDFNRNFEGLATDLRTLYDVYDSTEGSKLVQQSRSLLGYTNSLSGFDKLNASSKTQFLFYRGMIQAKGSSAGVQAYTNSKRFIDASLDEFWAVKIAEFGDNRTKVFPEISLFETDNTVDDIRFEFIGLDDDPTSNAILDNVAKGFNLIGFADDKRWNNFPEQKSELIQPLFLDAKVSSLTKLFVSQSAPSKKQLTEIDYWYNQSNNKLMQWNGFSWDIIVNKIHETNSHVYWRHNEPCDDVNIIRRELTSTTISKNIINGFAYNNDIDASNAFTFQGDIIDDIYSGIAITVSGTNGNDGTYIVQDSWYNKVYDTTYAIVNSTLYVNTIDGTITFIRSNFKSYESVKLSHGTSGNAKYYKVNSELVRLDLNAFYDIIHIYSLRPSIDSMNPAKLINKKTDGVSKLIPLWHPAYNIHNYKAVNSIDIQSNYDPAVYMNTLTNQNSSNEWNFRETGIVWLDTSLLDYIPYYDENIYTDINDRLYKWGKLMPYSDIKVYQWVQSSIHPLEWDTEALKQQGDITIPQNLRITGTAKTSIFKRSRSIYNGTIKFNGVTELGLQSPFVYDGQIISLFANSLLPDALQDYSKFVVVNADRQLTGNQTFNLADMTTNEILTLEPTIIPVSIINVGTTQTPIRVFKVDAGLMWEDDLITFNTIANGILPNYPDITTEIEYRVLTLNKVYDGDKLVYQTFSIALGSDVDKTPIPINDNGVGAITMSVTAKLVNIVPSFSNSKWEKQLFNKTRIFGAWLDSVSEPTIYWKQDPLTPIWYPTDGVEIYLNGTFVANATVQYNESLERFEVSTAGSNIKVQIYDYLDVIRPIHAITPEESSFDPDIEDDGVTLVQWKQYHEYSQVSTAFGANDAPIINYYFWVENKLNRSTNTTLSGMEIANLLGSKKEPYFVVQKPLDSSLQTAGYGYDQPPYGSIWSMGELPEFFNNIPVMYRQAVIRNISSLIVDNNHVIRFNRDLTLRDSPKTKITEIDLKNKHEEWILIREKQLSNIPKTLWDKLVESLSGVSLINGVVIPYLDRVLYDELYNTDTQYGLEEGQTFVNKEMGINTLLTYLQDSTKDFSPIDIDDFFAHNDFTSSSGIVTAVNEIYDRFSSEHVNGIWFEMLKDALSVKSRYKGLMKTSWVVVQGSWILNVNGLFDE
ncbi:MAG: hypothetical protein ACXW2E_00795 [Nitrososphaeraceae archaeon]